MRTVNTWVFTALLTTLCMHAAAAERAHKSGYAGQETRAIKSLSPSDIAELNRGGGWGLAKAAELNGLPGPAHLLDLKDEIGLSNEQTLKIQTLFNQMKAEAIKQGQRLIMLEQQLEERFQSDPPGATDLTAMLTAIGQTRTKLRFTHLAAHLKTPGILTNQQLANYNTLRGYSLNNPCASVPEGHDATMWKMHNGCN